MINIVLFGPPGAGKGTQSEKIVERFEFIHISTGDLLRKEIAEGTQLGLKAKSLIDQGILVPDNVVIGMIENQLRMNESSKGFIFDGFPRTVKQAEALDELLLNQKSKVSAMISLEVPREELIERLKLRAKSSGRTDDADPAIIENRIEEYNKKTKPVADFYDAQGKLIKIDGVGEVDDIFERISSSIEKL